MPRKINANVLAEAAKEQNQPIYLVELELDSGTLYFTDNNENVVFPSSGGHTYLAWGIEFDPVKSSVTGEIDRVIIRFDNTNLSMSAYLAMIIFKAKSLL